MDEKWKVQLVLKRDGLAREEVEAIEKALIDAAHKIKAAHPSICDGKTVLSIERALSQDKDPCGGHSTKPPAE